MLCNANWPSCPRSFRCRSSKICWCKGPHAWNLAAQIVVLADMNPGSLIKTSAG
nr:hypothetical protein [Tanacetum cinerariifolium]